LDNKQTALTTKTKTYNDLNTTVRGLWKADPDFNKMTYQEYLQSERPDVLIARSEMQKAVKAVTDAQLATNIPGAEKLGLVKERLSKIEKGVSEAG
jgi:hypothetical protein